MDGLLGPRNGAAGLGDAGSGGVAYPWHFEYASWCLAVNSGNIPPGGRDARVAVTPKIPTDSRDRPPCAGKCDLSRPRMVGGVQRWCRQALQESYTASVDSGWTELNEVGPVRMLKTALASLLQRMKT